MSSRLDKARELVRLRLGGVGVAECIEALVDAKLEASVPSFASKPSPPPPVGGWNPVAPNDASEAHVLEVSVDGYGFTPSCMFGELTPALEALEKFEGGGLSSARIRQWVPVTPPANPRPSPPSVSVAGLTREEADEARRAGVVFLDRSGCGFVPAWWLEKRRASPSESGELPEVLSVTDDWPMVLPPGAKLRNGRSVSDWVRGQLDKNRYYERATGESVPLEQIDRSTLVTPSMLDAQKARTEDGIDSAGDNSGGVALVRNEEPVARPSPPDPASDYGLHTFLSNRIAPDRREPFLRSLREWWNLAPTTPDAKAEGRRADEAEKKLANAVADRDLYRGMVLREEGWPEDFDRLEREKVAAEGALAEERTRRERAEAQLADAVRKWTDYEQNYILPCFKWVNNGGGNAVSLLVQALRQRAADAEAKLADAETKLAELEHPDSDW